MKKNILKKIFILLLPLILTNKSFPASYGKYISFGFRLGHEFSGGTTLSFKTGFGIHEWPEAVSDDSPPFRSFKSISLGYRVRIGKQPNYFYSDIQTGKILGGIGIGVAFWRDNDVWRLSPRGSVFGGLAIWGTFDTVMSDDIKPDIGIQLLLPFPFVEQK